MKNEEILVLAGSIGGKTSGQGKSIPGKTAGNKQIPGKTESPSSSNGSNDGNSGSSDCIVVNVLNAKDQFVYIKELRTWRDEVLTQSIMGRVFIKTYYKCSPTIVKISKKIPVINKPLRRGVILIANIV